MHTALSADTKSCLRLENGRVAFSGARWVEADSAVALSSDGRWAATASRDGVIHVWHERRRVATFDFEFAALELAFSPDNLRLAIGTAARVNIYRLPSLELAWAWDTPHPLRCLALQGESLAAGLRNGQLLLANREKSTLMTLSERPLSAVAWFNETPVAADLDGSVWLGDKLVAKPSSHPVRAIASYPQRNLLALASDTVRLLQIESGELLDSWPVKAESLGFTQDGILCGLPHGEDVPRSFKIATSPPKSLGISSQDGPGTMCFSPDSKMLATSCYGRIDLWQIEPFARRAQVEVPGVVARLEYVGGQLMALMENSLMLDFKLPALGVVSEKPLPFRDAHVLMSRGLALAPGPEGTDLGLWDFSQAPARELCTLPQYRVLKMQVSDTGRFLVATTHQAGVEFPFDLYAWDLQEPQVPIHLGEFRSICGPVFSQRGVEIIAAGHLRCWEPGPWSARVVMGVPEKATRSSCLVRVGESKLMTGEYLLDPARQKVEQILDLGDRVVDLVASPRGRWLAVRLAEKGLVLLEKPA